MASGLRKVTEPQSLNTEVMMKTRQVSRFLLVLALRCSHSPLRRR
jgi:hypothetical protein